MGAEAIIPAYNEERTIGAVVAAARACRLIERVHVIDDGSTDRTAQAARRAGATVCTLRPNQGKTAALIRGAAAARADVLVLLDGDLLGLRAGHIEALLGPVLAGRAEMSIGIFNDGRWVTDLSQRLTPFLNGQRALRREIIEGLLPVEKMRYAADTILSRYAKRRGAKVRMVPLSGLTHVMKEEKVGLCRGFAARLAMYRQVFKAFLVRLP
ncbi:MAG: glycosyltransferase [Patescibacteria group bacterium]